MSFKYNRFFVSSCLSLAAVSFLISPDVKAGFEWTPPEKKVPAEVIRPVVPETMPTPVPVETPVVEELPVVEAAEEPEITIKVLDEAPEQPVKEAVVEDAIVEQESEIIEIVDSIEEPVVPTEDIIFNEPVIEPVAETIEAEVLTEDIIEEEYIEIPSEPETPIEIVEDAVIEDTAPLTELPVEEASVSADDEALTLDFNPGTQSDTGNQPVAILPEDIEQDISEVALPVESAMETKVVEKPVENIFWAKEESFDVIEGFGNDLPLALALRQIVPARYAFDFGDGVNAGTRISWEGGKPWNDVLEAALSPIGVDYSIKRSNFLALEVAQAPVASAEIGTPVEEISATSESVESMPKTIAVPDVSNDDESDVIEIVEEIEEASDYIEEAAEGNPAVADISSPLDEIYKDVEKLEQDVLETDVSDFPGVATSTNQLENTASDTPVTEQKKNEPLDAAPEAVEILDAPEKEARVTPKESITWNALENTAAEVDSAVLEEAIESEVLSASDDSDALIEIVENDVLEEEQNVAIASLGDAPKIEEQAEEVVEAAPVQAAEAVGDTVKDALVVSSSAINNTVSSLQEISPAAEETTSNFRSQPSEQILVWQARKGVRVKTILQDWAKTENIAFSWNGNDNHKVNKDVFISGTFSNAVDILLTTSVESPPTFSFRDAPDYTLFIDGE